MKLPLDSMALEFYELLSREYFEEVERFLSDLRWLLENVCESPIEQFFLIDLPRCNQFYKPWIRKEGPQGSSVLGFRLAGWGPATGNFRVMIYPQHQIRLESDVTLTEPKTYRVDFLIEVVEEVSLAEERPIFYLVVEMDGHEFHERTKAQAQRDKERDRNLTRAGYKVMRFTGSEIYQSVKKQVERPENDGALLPIAAQVMSMIEKAANERSKGN